jgi:hypothetical protein
MCQKKKKKTLIHPNSYDYLEINVDVRAIEALNIKCIKAEPDCKSDEPRYSSNALEKVLLEITGKTNDIMEL